MKFRFAHNNINVKDLEKSIAFYEKMLGLSVTRRRKSEDGSFELAFLGDGVTDHLLELTWLREHPQAYELGENEIHLALTVDHYDKALAFHRQEGVVCFENEGMGIYFIEDPDGYWVEIVPIR